MRTLAIGALSVLGVGVASTSPIGGPLALAMLAVGAIGIAKVQSQEREAKKQRANIPHKDEAQRLSKQKAAERMEVIKFNPIVPYHQARFALHDSPLGIRENSLSFLAEKASKKTHEVMMEKIATDRHVHVHVEFSLVKLSLF